MSKYKAGDGFIIRIKSHKENFHLYEMEQGFMFSEECLDGLKKAGVTLIEKEKKKAYEAGMLDAWICAKKIVGTINEGGLPMNVIEKEFGVLTYEEVFFKHTPMAAKKIIEEYEAQMNKVKAGDAVDVLEQTGVVLAIDGEIASVYVITDEYAKVQEFPVCKLKRLGYSIDVRKVLTGACVAESMKKVNGSV